ncbi:hypothetical protein [Schaalia hyovaginalis]|uniref:Uncharacterized protein n=1 Tax=Schaalia hyovaginalis TaxID=29316 RepID=A0A923E3T7_9ACTO|nr:hypothetical protein [Schaalia hyovaginalis]MBB6334353.1 hypothetical protein [Schaalia hyovaginalis]
MTRAQLDDLRSDHWWDQRHRSPGFAIAAAVASTLLVIAWGVTGCLGQAHPLLAFVSAAFFTANAVREALLARRLLAERS